jgi:hypothetical protein
MAPGADKLCAAYAEKGVILVFYVPESRSYGGLPLPHSPKIALTGPMQASGGPAYR